MMGSKPIRSSLSVKLVRADKRIRVNQTYQPDHFRPLPNKTESRETAISMSKWIFEGLLARALLEYLRNVN